ncbi:MAG: SDR family NAD(P)-dependent oxidoreductase [Alphaproteobacteria bacterium]|jgi:NAD(P)-dependent dehydrogenase (short-subunit alcohol dehydrogenase family)|nr:SDR family NAD(P)-dependent oxidoreductase [Alphaproteobacteria bacterium]
MRAVVFGVSGGIGRALAEGLVERGADAVHGYSRSAIEDIPGVRMGRADITNEAELADAAARVEADGPPELVIVSVGILSQPGGLEPEKSYKHQEMDAFEQVFRANTFGPALVAKHFLPIMPRKQRAVFAALSARVGSISDNRIGGWHAYRASKAALNMLIRNYAIEQGRRNKEFIAVGLHPGTVDTALSEPFQGNVPDKKLFSPTYSANCLLDVIEGLGPDHSGQVFDYAGAAVPA